MSLSGMSIACTMATMDVKESQKLVTTFEVKSVYIYIPAELSATGFELKISGVVRILRKVSVVS